MQTSLVSSLSRHLTDEFEVVAAYPGGNSVVYEIRTQSLHLAAKHFHGTKSRIFRSYNRELSALQFLRSHQVKNIPNIYFADESLHYIVMDFIEGQMPDANLKSSTEILNFIFELREIYLRDSSFPLAIDAAQDLNMLRKQIEIRLIEFTSIQVSEYLPNYYRNIEILTSKSSKNVSKANFTYSVSDLGLHNLLVKNGNYFFFDLEFFGKDSPQKLIGDFVLHPQNRFKESENSFFVGECVDKFKLNEDEVAEYIRLLSIKWSLICYKRLHKMIFSNTNRESIDKQKEIVRYYLEVSHQKKSSEIWNVTLEKSVNFG